MNTDHAPIRKFSSVPVGHDVFCRSDKNAQISFGNPVLTMGNEVNEKLAPNGEILERTVTRCSASDGYYKQIITKFDKNKTTTREYNNGKISKVTIRQDLQRGERKVHLEKVCDFNDNQGLLTYTTREEISFPGALQRKVVKEVRKTYDGHDKAHIKQTRERRTTSEYEGSLKKKESSYTKNFDADGYDYYTSKNTKLYMYAEGKCYVRERECTRNGDGEYISSSSITCYDRNGNVVTGEMYNQKASPTPNALI